MKTIAYFSAEYSVADDLPIYAGGLGILAGDLAMQAGDDGLDFVALGLVYHEAFTGDDPSPVPLINRLEGQGFKRLQQNGSELIVEIKLADETFAAAVWEKQFGSARLLLLDSRLPQNSSRGQHITDRLYDPSCNIEQELLLGFGGITLFEKLGISPAVYHLNEGHMAWAGLAVVLQTMQAQQLDFKQAVAAAKSKIIATKHTILPGAGLTLAPDEARRYLEPLLQPSKVNFEAVTQLATKPDGQFSGTKLLMALAGRSSGVSRIHVAAEAKAHPGSPLIPITNGVYRPRWQAPEMQPDKLQSTHNQSKQQLLNYVMEQTGVQLSADKLTVVWARRMAQYKRPEMLVGDLERLKALITSQSRAIQFIVAGQANPADQTGIALMNQVIAAAHNPELASGLVYLPHYNPATARLLVQGADLWLNTPVRGMEACGTSGMKASLNGALQLSTSDGWFDEVDQAELGWVLPENATSATLYDLLEREVAPLFYDRPTDWGTKMLGNMALIEQKFSAQRMLHDYQTQLYFPTD